MCSYNSAGRTDDPEQSMSPTPRPQGSSGPAGPAQIEFNSIGKTRAQAVFDEPDLGSDGGAITLRGATEANGIIKPWPL